MTEEKYQEARKIMQRANWLRGMITQKKARVAKWTALEDFHTRKGHIQVAGAVKQKILEAINQLADWRQKFRDLKFPENE